MSEAAPHAAPDETARRLDPDQYERLKACAEAGDLGPWNEWREAEPETEIWLEGADLHAAHLSHAYLKEAHLAGANLVSADLRDANLQGAHLEGAELRNARLEGTNLSWALLQGALMFSTHLEGARLTRANLHGASLGLARMAEADLSFTNLQDANLALAFIEGTRFEAAAVNGGTLIWRSKIDRATNFTGVGLDTARVEPGMKQLLQYNVRRIAWETWYKAHGVLKWPVKAFWWMSDYGRSTGRIVGWFFGIALAFAILYFLAPGLVDHLDVEGRGWVHRLVRSCYFSVVTMTTLGFGDMYAMSTSLWGHLLLTLQVLSGYVLLGALVTRFAVLFTAGGPEGNFVGEKPLAERLKNRWQALRSKLSLRRKPPPQA
jgi:hypothetical protein